MFKKLVIVFIVVNFLFCYKSVSSLGVDVPSTIKEDIYMLNYDEEIDTLYLATTGRSNFYGASVYNSSPNSFLVKIRTNLQTLKSFQGKEIAKNSFNIIYPYATSHIFFQVSVFDYDQKLGYLIIEIFSMKGRKLKEFDIKTVIIPKGTRNGGMAIPDIVLEGNVLTNQSLGKNLILINIIQNNKNLFLKKCLKSKEKIELPIPDLKRNETVFVIISNSWSIFKSQYHILNKKNNNNCSFKKVEENKIFWCKDYQDKIFGFLSYENLLTIFCYSEISKVINTHLIINKNTISSQAHLIKTGWNKINIKSEKESCLAEIEIQIDEKIYKISKIFLENHQQDKIKYYFSQLDKEISYTTIVKNKHKFMILSKNGIVCCEALSPETKHIPSYYFKTKTVTINCEYNEVVIVELTTSLDMIRPTLSE